MSMLYLIITYQQPIVGQWTGHLILMVIQITWQHCWRFLLSENFLLTYLLIVLLVLLIIVLNSISKMFRKRNLCTVSCMVAEHSEDFDDLTWRTFRILACWQWRNCLKTLSRPSSRSVFDILQVIELTSWRSLIHFYNNVNNSNHM